MTTNKFVAGLAASAQGRVFLKICLILSMRKHIDKYGHHSNFSICTIIRQYLSTL